MSEDKAIEIIKCRNCETEFSGNFCPNCGQSKKNYDIPFHFLIIDFAGNVFAFDTRVLRTLKSLLLHPGQLAGEYIQGKRERYMPPFRFYVFISFIFFLILSTTSIDSNIVNVEAGGVSADSLIANADSTGSFTVGNTDISMNSFMANKEIFISKFLTWLSWSMFLLMPIYGSLLWLFFRRKYQYYLGHLILAINQHAFSFIVFILLITINLIFPDRETKPENFLLLALPLYYIIGAKQLYGYKWWTTIKRLLVIWFLYFICLIASVTTIVLIIFPSISW
jgi:hypothetical protein